MTLLDFSGAAQGLARALSPLMVAPAAAPCLQQLP